MKSAVKTKARKTNNQASFGQSLLKNNMEVDAAMELSRHLDETGSPSVCLLGSPAMWFSCIQTLAKRLDFLQTFMLGLFSLHNVCR